MFEEKEIINQVNDRISKNYEIKEEKTHSNVNYNDFSEEVIKNCDDCSKLFDELYSKLDFDGLNNVIVHMLKLIKRTEDMNFNFIQPLINVDLFEKIKAILTHENEVYNYNSILLLKEIVYKLGQDVISILIDVKYWLEYYNILMDKLSNPMINTEFVYFFGALFCEAPENRVVIAKHVNVFDIFFNAICSNNTDLINAGLFCFAEILEYVRYSELESIFSKENFKQLIAKLLNLSEKFVDNNEIIKRIVRVFRFLTNFIEFSFLFENIYQDLIKFCSFSLTKASVETLILLFNIIYICNNDNVISIIATFFDISIYLKQMNDITKPNYYNAVFNLMYIILKKHPEYIYEKVRYQLLYEVFKYVDNCIIDIKYKFAEVVFFYSAKCMEIFFEMPQDMLNFLLEFYSISNDQNRILYINIFKNLCNTLDQNSELYNKIRKNIESNDIVW